MGRVHTVAQGEYLSKIARSYGFANYLTIWDAPENTELKKRRESPNVLFPGDELFVPDRQEKMVPLVTGQGHRFVVKRDRVLLLIVLKDLKHRPLSGHEGTLILETAEETFRTGPDGTIEREILEPRAIAKGLLLDRGTADDEPRLERRIPLRLGSLDPETKVSGQIARLNNLGYDAGEVPDRPLTESAEQEIVTSLRFRSAVEEFQCDFALAVDGMCGAKTASKIKAMHGS